MVLLPSVRGIRIRTRALSSLVSRLISTTHTVKEVEIPVPFIKGHIAGKLWESKGETSINVPPIICLPGWGDNVTSFEPLVPLLLADRPMQSLLAFDFPGHGLSYHSPGIYSDLHHEGLLTILRIIRHFGWQKIKIIGHSFGGLVGLSFTASFPDLVQKLIGLDIFAPLFINIEGHNYTSLLSTCIENLLDAESKILNSANRPPPSYTRQEMIERMMKGRAPQGGLSREGCDLLIDRGSKKLPDGKLQFTHDSRNTQFFFLARLTLGYLTTMCEGVRADTALLSCFSEDGFDPVTSLPLAKDLLKILMANAKSFQHERVRGPHHVHMLRPEVVAPMINKFLN